jgi:hypothetical protein
MQINTTIIIANDGVLNEDEETFPVAGGGGAGGNRGEPPGKGVGGGTTCSGVAESAPEGDTDAVSREDT